MLSREIAAFAVTCSDKEIIKTEPVRELIRKSHKAYQ